MKIQLKAGVFSHLQHVIPSLPGLIGCSILLMSPVVSFANSHSSDASAELQGEGMDLEVSGELTIEGEDDVHIYAKRIQNPTGSCITIKSATKVVIEASYIGPCGGEAITVHNSKDIVVKNNYIKKSRSGLYAVSSSYVRFFDNYVKNVTGPRPRGQMVQFNQVSGAGNTIHQNISENILGQSVPEDLVNLYLSNGTPSSPIMVMNNYFIGGGPSASGGGVMLGDNGGSYQRATGNIVVDPGQYGMAIAGGTNMRITGNQVYAKRQSFTNVGLYAWNQKAASCSGIEISNNKVGWTNKNGVANPYWDGKNCGAIKLIGNDFKAAYKVPARPIGWGPNWAMPTDF